MTDEATASCRLDGETVVIEPVRPPKEIPVLLRGPLVRAFLDGQKTVTRRTDLDKWRKAKPGDKIWFKETWAAYTQAYQDDLVELTEGKPSDILDTYGPVEVVYRCDDDGRASPWRPSIFMPKWAARCWAVVEDIREERLRDITPADALSEGICAPVGHHHQLDCETPNPVDDFAVLWDSINGKKEGLSWADNPIVSRIQFRRIEVPNG